MEKMVTVIVDVIVIQIRKVWRKKLEKKKDKFLSFNF